MEELNKQSIIDEEHLRLLVIFHRIYGIIVIVFSLLSIGYFLLLGFIFSYPEDHSRYTYTAFQAPNPEFMNVFLIVMIILLAVCLIVGVCNILSAQYIKKRKSRIFSIVVACVDCVSIPMGTIIGILTLVVLLRTSVIEFYKTSNLPG